MVNIRRATEVKRLPLTPPRVVPVAIVGPSGNQFCPSCKSPDRYAHDSYARPGDVIACSICGVEYRPRGVTSAALVPESFTLDQRSAA